MGGLFSSSSPEEAAAKTRLASSDALAGRAETDDELSIHGEHDSELAGESIGDLPLAGTSWRPLLTSCWSTRMPEDRRHAADLQFDDQGHGVMNDPVWGTYRVWTKTEQGTRDGTQCQHFWIRVYRNRESEEEVDWGPATVMVEKPGWMLVQFDMKVGVSGFYLFSRSDLRTDDSMPMLLSKWWRPVFTLAWKGGVPATLRSHCKFEFDENGRGRVDCEGWRCMLSLPHPFSGRSWWMEMKVDVSATLLLMEAQASAASLSMGAKLVDVQTVSPGFLCVGHAHSDFLMFFVADSVEHSPPAHVPFEWRPPLDMRRVTFHLDRSDASMLTSSCVGNTGRPTEVLFVKVGDSEESSLCLNSWIVGWEAEGWGEEAIRQAEGHLASGPSLKRFWALLLLGAVAQLAEARLAAAGLAAVCACLDDDAGPVRRAASRILAHLAQPLAGQSKPEDSLSVHVPVPANVHVPVPANRRGQHEHKLPRACQTAGCAYICTWHPTHCCMACASGSPSRHGGRCDRKPLLHAAGAEDTLQAAGAEDTAPGSRSRESTIQLAEPTIQLAARAALAQAVDEDAARSGEGLRVLFLSNGSRGDVQPMVVLGKHLQARGCELLALTRANLVDFCKARGLDAKPAFPDLAFMFENAGGVSDESRSSLVHFEQVWRRQNPGVLADPRTEINQFRPDAIVWTAGECHDIAIEYEVLQGVPAIPLIGCGLEGVLGHYRGAVSRVPVRPCFVTTSSHLDERANTEGVNGIHQTGAWLPEEDPSPQELSEEPLLSLVEFLEQGAPPVAIGWGSLLAEGLPPAAMLVRALLAVESAGHRAVVIGGWAKLHEVGRDLVAGHTTKLLDEVGSSLPEMTSLRSGQARLEMLDGLRDFARTRCCFVAQVSHAWLFPRCSCVVHHGGAGTTHASLSAGRPCVITPLAWDQFQWARVVDGLGVGVGFHQRLRSVCVQPLAKAISQALCCAPAAQRLGEKMREEPGVERAAEALCRFLRHAAAADGGWRRRQRVLSAAR